MSTVLIPYFLPRVIDHYKKMQLLIRVLHLYFAETRRFYFVSSGLDGRENKKDKVHYPIFPVQMRHRGLEPRTT